MLSRFPVLAQGLRERRRSLVWWSLGVAVYIAIIAAVWPSMESSAGEMGSFIEQLPQAWLDLMGASGFSMATGAGYVSGELFGFMIPIFILVLTIGAGAGAIAGAEDRGTLDLVLSHPISRRRVFAQSAALVIVDAALFGLVIVVSLAIANPLADLQIAFTDMIGAVVGVALLGVVFGWMALAIGSATGSRGLALGLTGGLGALTYLAGNLSGLVDFLHWAKWVSPFWYATSGSPLDYGYVWWHALPLLGLSVVLFAMGMLRFERRNLAA